MEENVCFQNTEHLSTVATTLAQIRGKGEFCDVTLVSDDEVKMQAHRVILSAFSELFRSILCDSPHPHALLYLSGVHSSQLEKVLDYIYNGEVQIGQDNVRNFLVAANKLKVIKPVVANSSSKNSSSEAHGEENRMISMEENVGLNSDLEKNMSEAFGISSAFTVNTVVKQELEVEAGPSDLKDSDFAGDVKKESLSNMRGTFEDLLKSNENIDENYEIVYDDEEDIIEEISPVQNQVVADITTQFGCFHCRRKFATKMEVFGHKESCLKTTRKKVKPFIANGEKPAAFSLVRGGERYMVASSVGSYLHTSQKVFLKNYSWVTKKFPSLDEQKKMIKMGICKSPSYARCVPVILVLEKEIEEILNGLRSREEKDCNEVLIYDFQYL